MRVEKWKKNMVRDDNNRHRMWTSYDGSKVWYKKHFLISINVSMALMMIDSLYNNTLYKYSFNCFHNITFFSNKYVCAIFLSYSFVLFSMTFNVHFSYSFLFHHHLLPLSSLLNKILPSMQFHILSFLNLLFFPSITGWARRLFEKHSNFFS